VPRLALLLSLVPVALAAAPRPQHFELSAAFDPPRKPASTGALAVSFRALDPDVRVNESPAPRIKLASAEVLVDKQPEATDKIAPYDPETAAYLDLALPVYFPVAFAKSAPKGTHQVPVTLTYFYCSKRAGWCRKGTAELTVAVNVP